jgi:DGQHR domain-containing protein
MLINAYAVSLITQGKWRFYTLTIPSDVLARCCYVSARYDDPTEGFQRRLDRKRAQAIAEYIDKDLGTIPSAVILSAQPAAKLEVTGRGKSLKFVESPKAFLVLDGQHRVYGYRLATTPLRVPVVIYNGLSRAQEVKLFVDINTKQRPVSNELLLDIQHLTGEENEYDTTLRLVFDKLKADRNGPLFNRLSASDKERGKISRVTFNAAIKPLLSKFKDADSERIHDLISAFLTAVLQHLSTRDMEDVLANATVFRAMFEMFPRAAQRVSDLYQNSFLAENFYEVLDVVFSHLHKKVLNAPGNSYTALGEKLIQKFDKNVQI